jgi:hypothetical protein
VETDVLGVGRDELDPGVVDAVTGAHPRPRFKEQILQRFADGNIHRPRTTFGNVNADVLAHYDPTFARDDFVEIIRKGLLAGVTQRQDKARRSLPGPAR